MSDQGLAEVDRNFTARRHSRRARVVSKVSLRSRSVAPGVPRMCATVRGTLPRRGRVMAVTVPCRDERRRGTRCVPQRR